MPFDLSALGAVPAPPVPVGNLGLAQNPDGTMGTPQGSLGQAPAQQLAPVIDVGGSSGAKPGDPGSQFAWRPAGAPGGKEGGVSGGSGFDLSTLGAVPAPSPEPAPAPTETAPGGPQPSALASALGNVGGALGAFTHGLSMGLDDPLNRLADATVGRGMDALLGTHGPSIADWEQQQRQQFAQAHPVISGVAEAAGSLPTFMLADGATALPSLGTNVLARGGNLALNAARAAGLSGAAGFGLTDGDAQQRLQGAKSAAEVGGVLGAAVPVAASAIGGVVRPVARAVAPFTDAGRQMAVGRILSESAGGAPAIQPPPIEGFEPNLAQATGNPNLAALVRQRSSLDQSGAMAERTAQNAAIKGAFTGAAGAPALSTGADAATASSGFTKATREADKLARAEESRLWNVPEMKEKIAGIVPAVQTSIAQELQSMDPGLRVSFTPQIRAYVSHLTKFPSKASIGDINAVRKGLNDIGRDHNNPSAALVANRLSGAILRGLDQTTMSPEASAAYQAARNFTRQRATLFGTQDARALLHKNAAGVYTKDASEGAKGFLGPEGAGNVRDIGQFLDGIKAKWTALNHEAEIHGDTGARKVTAADIGNARDALIQHTRDYIISNALGAAKSTTLDAADESNVLHNRLNSWIEKNKGWISKSGLFDQAQIGMLERIQKAAQMAARTENLRGSTNSTTYEKLAGHRFVDAFLGGVFGRVAGAGLGGVLGYMTEGPLGAGVGLMTGEKAASALRGLYEAPKEKILKLLDTALRDPQVARDLMMRASRGNAKMFRQTTRRAIQDAGLAATIPRENPDQGEYRAH